MNLDEILEKLIDEYMESRGIDPEKLDDLSEEEFNSLCADAQIDAYLKGRLDESKRFS